MRVLLKDFFSNQKQAIELAAGGNISQHAAQIQGPLRGLYARLGRDCVGLFTIGGKLFISVNGRAAEVQSHETPVSYTRSGDLSEIRVKQDSDEHIITYESGNPVSTLFYSEDEEDADFGLWLHNVLRSDERRRIFITSWANRID